MTPTHPTYARAAGVKLALTPILMAVVIVGCSPTVRVEAPEEPIEINVNLRIEQDVRIRIDRELEEVIEGHEDIFGIPSE